jgi:hypothetical protein
VVARLHTERVLSSGDISKSWPWREWALVNVGDYGYLAWTFGYAPIGCECDASRVQLYKRVKRRKLIQTVRTLNLYSARVVRLAIGKSGDDSSLVFKRQPCRVW